MIEQLEQLWTPEDEEHMRLSADAEARGDAQAALDEYRQTVRFTGSPREYALEHLARLGDDAPEWLVARWVRTQAYRWMLMEKDPRTDDALRLALTTHELPDEVTPTWWREYGTRVLGADVLCEEHALYHAGGLRDFIETRASDELLARAGRVREWPDASCGVYELVDVDHDVLVVRDHASGEELRTLHVGAAVGQAGGSHVLGRLVPIGAAPGLMFERRPIPVDRHTVAELLTVLGSEVPEALYGVLSLAVEAGRIPDRPGTRVATFLWSDILPDDDSYGDDSYDNDSYGDDAYGDDSYGDDSYDDVSYEVGEDSELPGRVHELMGSGLSEGVAEALGTCEMALWAAGNMPSALGVFGPHAAYNLMNPPVYEAALVHLTAPDDADAWEKVASYVPEPSRSQCLELAAVARG